MLPSTIGTSRYGDVISCRRLSPCSTVRYHWRAQVTTSLALRDQAHRPSFIVTP